jgi:acetyltransferase-like isoleucine patch superfamily enzyme
MKNIEASDINIGSNVSIAESARIRSGKLVIGSDVTIGERVNIACGDGVVEIGDQTYIGNDVTIALSSFTIGEYCKLHNHSLLNGKASVVIGDNCWIGQNCILNGEADLRIGNNVGIGTYSSVWTHGYFGQLIDGCNIFSVRSTIIEDDVWLVGSYNTIFPGVTIGAQAVLMGNSVATKSLQAGHTYSGNPAVDISSKVGLPYTPISFDQRIQLVRDTIAGYLADSGIAHSSNSDVIDITGYGHVVFNDASLGSGELACDTVAFFEEVRDWTPRTGLSKFCLTTKTYQKNYSPIEILTKKILNPVAARFVRLSA